MERWSLVRLVTACACAAALVGAANASAALVTLGSSFDGPPAGVLGCGQGCTVAQTAVQSPGTAVSPVDGVVVRFSLSKPSKLPGYALQVLTMSGTNGTVTATSAPQTPAGAGVETFSTSIPIRRRQVAAVKVPPTGNIGLTEPPATKAVLFGTALADGESRVGVENPFGIGFNAVVQPAPTISTISPTGSAPAAATQVTITGTDFEGASAVSFGAVPAAAFTVNSESQITAFSPPGKGAVPVSVTTNAGVAVSPQAFTYATADATAPPAAAAAPTPTVPVKPTCTVPRLKGKTLKAAKRRIRGADCSVGKLTKKKGATAKNGEVVNQVPKPGATVAEDTKVKVTLAP